MLIFIVLSDGSVKLVAVSVRAWARSFVCFDVRSSLVATRRRQVLVHGDRMVAQMPTLRFTLLEVYLSVRGSEGRVYFHLIAVNRN